MSPLDVVSSLVHNDLWLHMCPSSMQYVRHCILIWLACWATCGHSPLHSGQVWSLHPLSKGKANSRMGNRTGGQGAQPGKRRCFGLLLGLWGCTLFRDGREWLLPHGVGKTLEWKPRSSNDIPYFISDIIQLISVFLWQCMSKCD